MPCNPNTVEPPAGMLPLYDALRAVTVDPDWLTVAFQPLVTRSSPAYVQVTVQLETAASPRGDLDVGGESAGPLVGRVVDPAALGGCGRAGEHCRSGGGRGGGQRGDDHQGRGGAGTEIVMKGPSVIELSGGGGGASWTDAARQRALDAARRCATATGRAYDRNARLGVDLSVADGPVPGPRRRPPSIY